MRDYKPKKGDMAKFKEWKAPAMRYETRWAKVLRLRRKDETVDLEYPSCHRVTPMERIPVTHLVFKRGDLVFTVPA